MGPYTGDLRLDKNRGVWVCNTHLQWVKVVEDVRYEKKFHGQAIKRFTPEEEKQLGI